MSKAGNSALIKTVSVHSRDYIAMMDAIVQQVAKLDICVGLKRIFVYLYTHKISKSQLFSKMSEGSGSVT